MYCKPNHKYIVHNHSSRLELLFLASRTVNYISFRDGLAILHYILAVQFTIASKWVIVIA